MEQTLLMIKPDAVRARRIGKIIDLIEQEFEIADIRMKRFTREEAERFYAVHRGKPFFEPLVEFITSGPVVGLLLTGENVIQRLRDFIGATDPAKARPGSIRALYGSNIQENAVHASDSAESAAYEIPFFFEERRQG